MSTVQSPPGKDPGTLQSTRQMLDDLDALMNRMLAIPVNDLDDAATPPRELVSVSPMSATLTVLEPSAGEEQSSPIVEPSPVREIAPNYLTTMKPASDETKPLPKLVDPSLIMTLPSKRDDSFASPIPEEVIPQSILELPAPNIEEDLLIAPVFRPRRSLAGLLLLPLVGFNRVFDSIAYFLGKPGQWLSGPRGRNILGWTGLLMMAAAGLWVVKDWLGWTW
jgi:hypothetical protein